MKRFALIRMVHQYAMQECLLTCNRRSKAQAVEYFRSCYPSEKFDHDGYVKHGNVTWCVAEFFMPISQ